MIKSFNMATMPERVDTAVKTIDSVYDQADVVRLYLNNFDSVPEEFKRDKVEIFQGVDLRSTGKLYSALNKDEYYFCIDDDLEYPDTYANDMISKLNAYDDKIVVTLHGKILPPVSKSSYFKRPTKRFQCLGSVASDTWINVIGNGVSVWNTNNFRVDYRDWKYNYMDDIYVSIEMQKQKVPGLCVAHRSNYLKYNSPKGTNLHAEYHKNDSTQTEIADTIVWRHLGSKGQNLTVKYPNVKRLRNKRKVRRK